MECSDQTGTCCTEGAGSGEWFLPGFCNYPLIDVSEP